MLSSLFRKRVPDEKFLRHSEWARRLGIPLIVSLAGIKSISMMVFIILPLSLTQLAGPSTAFALIFTFVIVFLSSAHLSEIACAMPKNCVQYHLAYSIFGEFPAFLIGWMSLIDYLGQAALFCRAWADHFNLLFRGAPSKSLSFELFSKDSTILAHSVDFLSVIAAVITLCLLLCSLRVVGTICVSLLSVTLLITASCSLVAFFHLDPENWLKAEFFTFGLQGVLYSICALCACYTGIESTSSLLEETKNPRKRISSVVSFLVVTLTTIFFLVTLVFSLSTNVSALNDKSMIPEIFTVLNIPAAKYMLSVCSVCALSGGVLASFLPATRVIAALAYDRLLPFPKDTSTKSPYFSVLLCTLLVSFGATIQKGVLLNFVIFMAPLKLLITIILTYFQHYLAEPIGIPEETSYYKSIGKKRIRVRIDDGVSIEDSVYSQRSEDGDSSAISGSSFDTTAFLYMNATKAESDRLQRRLEREQLIAERNTFMPKSVSQYQTMDQNPKPTSSTKHNCVGESCKRNEDSASEDLHLFSAEQPEVPFFCSSPRPASPDLNSQQFRRAAVYLILFMITLVAFTLHARFFSTSNEIVYYFLSGILAFIFGLLCVLICKIQSNDFLHKRSSRVPLFPFVSLLPISMIVVSFSGSIPWSTLQHIVGSSFIGILIYALFGYRMSRQKNAECFIIQNKFVSSASSEQYCQIVGEEDTM